MNRDLEEEIGRKSDLQFLAWLRSNPSIEELQQALRIYPSGPLWRRIAILRKISFLEEDP